MNFKVSQNLLSISIATGLKNAINADTALSSLGVTATSSGAVITISSSSINNTKYTQAVSTGATETITFGGSHGSVAKVSPSNTFKGNAVLAVGLNTASITAVSGGGTATTNTYPITISSAAGQALTYDDNGNTTSDGTNSYAWDAENRLIKITYPGVNNYSQFTYDGLGHWAKIVETRSGSVTDTKQFIWCGNQACEVRDAGSTITAQYFSQGETISGTNYYYTKDHLGSIREITNSAGTIQSQYSYDPYGQVTKIAGSGPDADFQYAGYYYHAPSGLNLTLNRTYNASLGRWINRDPIEEAGSRNLYMYTNNNPIIFIDASGLFTITQPCSPNYRDPYLWTHNIFGRETGIQYYLNPNSQITGIPYFGDPSSPNNLYMPPNNIPSWGQPVGDIHSHTWLPGSSSYTYDPPEIYRDIDSRIKYIQRGGLQPRETPLNFSHDDITDSNNKQTPSLMINPLGQVYSYSPNPFFSL